MDNAEMNIFRYGPQRNPHATRNPGAYVVEDMFTLHFEESGCDQLPEGWTYDADAQIFTTDEAFNVNERKLGPDERAAFTAAKRKELESFFENQVWEFSDRWDPERTMKARFLLKWRVGADGKSEAKARLVLQGFNDPDALAGELATSSPTATNSPDPDGAT